MSHNQVVRELYQALSTGDVAGVLARLDPDVVVDEPLALPYGGTHHGRDVFVQSILGVMMGHAIVEITDFDVYEGGSGVIGRLTGTLTAHTTGEKLPITMIELHEVDGDTVRRIDVFLKNPEELAAFYARSAAGAVRV
ncbi:hypothetical protein GCM10010435_25410 [Winogradskya consettensis]|uniref:SnoaL-like domain-containing protein n=1 Tax=Winogradskya consettensis TaxID=113560 RepID=A0A919VLM0_9ACTN|nr:nuclear transport factor 2 family protein [Actinoplanes consettensis]GIM67873.1 hypothetical protein Aco04nite_08200 [Actinoplanes consettensis]